MDDDDALALTFADIMKFTGFPFVDNIAAISPIGIYAGKDIHQG